MTARAAHAVLLLVFTVMGVLTIPARLHVGDPYTWREEARSILLDGELSIPAGTALTHGERDQYFVSNPRNGLYYSKYGVMNGVLSAVPLFFEKLFTGELQAWDSDTRRMYLGLWNVALGLLVVSLLFRLSLFYGATPEAALLFVTFSCFCTFLFYYLRATSTELPQLLFFLAFFERLASYRASGATSARQAALAWLFLLLLCLTKVAFLALAPLALLFFPAAGWLAGKKKQAELAPILLRHALPGLLALLAVVFWVNWVKFGGPLETGYRWARHEIAHVIPPHQIFLNLFFNEQWGIPSHYPLVVLALPGWRAFWRKHPADAAFLLAASALFFWLIGGLAIWKGEWGYGPRYFLFLLPALSLPCLPLLHRFLAWKHGQGWATPALAVPVAAAMMLSFHLQLSVARLDPFFSYYAGPPSCAPAEVTRFFNEAHFGRITGEAWRMRNNLGSLWWAHPLARTCGSTEFVRYTTKLDTWLKRTNFYWFSPED